MTYTSAPSAKFTERGRLCLLDHYGAVWDVIDEAPGLGLLVSRPGLAGLCRVGEPGALRQAHFEVSIDVLDDGAHVGEHVVRGGRWVPLTTR